MPYRRPGENADAIWLDEEEYVEYLRYLKDISKEAYLSFRLGAEASLRLQKQTGFRLSWRIDHPDSGVEMIFAEVQDRKYGGNKDIKKHGIVYVPKSLWDEIEEYAERMNRGKDEPVIQRTGRQIREDCKLAGKRMAEDQSCQAYEELRPHDSRRYFARTMYRVYGVDKQVVMYLGGWETESIFDQYAHLLSEREIQSELARKDVLEIDVPADPRDTDLKRLHQAVQDLTDLVRADHKLERHGIDYKEIAHLSEDDLLEFKQWLRYESDTNRHPTLDEFQSLSRKDSGNINATILPSPVAGWWAKLAVARAGREIRAMQHDDAITDPTTPDGMAKILICAGLMAVLIVVYAHVYSVWFAALMLVGVWAAKAYQLDMEEPPGGGAAV